MWIPFAIANWILLGLQLGRVLPAVVTLPAMGAVSVVGLAVVLTKRSGRQ